MIRFATVTILAMLAAPAAAQEQRAATVMARWPAEEARQGVAADARHFYVNGNNVLGKYDKRTGRRVVRWEGPRALFPHILVHGGPRRAGLRGVQLSRRADG